MKRSILITVFLLICVSSAIVTVGCAARADADKVLVAEFKEEIEDAYCLYKEEFDLEPFIKKQNGAEYTVFAEQIDSETLDSIELEVNGFKFTPILNEEVLVSFTAQRNGEKVTSKEIKLYVEVDAEDIVKLFNLAWSDDYMSKDVNLDEDYIKTGGRTSIKVEWFGKEVSNQDRFQYIACLLGDEITDCYSVTDWEDAVLTFWVYNPTEYVLEFAPIWFHDGANLYLETDSRTIKTAKPNEWTEIKYSLRYFGMTENFFYDENLYETDYGQHFGIGYAEDGRKNINMNIWTCRWGGRKAAGKSYSYNFYIDGFDIRDYDPVKDSDLKHGYREFFDEDINSGDTANIAIVGNDGKTFSFEYKIVSDDGKFEVALIGSDWGKDYYGYFVFDSDGSLEDYTGVTVSESAEGYKKVDFDLERVDLIYGENKPSRIDVMFVNNNTAIVSVRNAGLRAE